MSEPAPINSESPINVIMTNDLKKAYKEKLNVFHPDKNKKLPIVQKVAAEKTRQVVEAFRLLSDLLNGSSLK